MLLHHRFIDAAKANGTRLAVHDLTTGTRLSYHRALIAVLILSRIFNKLERGNIGLMLPTSAGCILSKIAILMSGRTPVMINYSTGAEQNARYSQQKCDFQTIITSRALLEKIECPFVEGMLYLEDIMAEIGGLQKLRGALLARLPANLLKKLVYNGPTSTNAVILFTSGSEKDPKAVPLSHANIIANVESCSRRFQFSGDDTFLATLPFFHVFGLTVNMWVPFFHHNRVITYANPLDYKKICEIARKYKPTMMVGTPSFFWGYLRRSEPGDFSSLRIALVGADKCPGTLRESFMEKHGITLLEGYGATECSPVISANSPDDNCPGSVGKPIDGVQVRIEHYETGEECAPGEDGRILVKGDNVMKGYFNDFEQTSLHIRHGWYDTGDMGNIDHNGYLWHVGRLKRFVKIGGEMVSLVKIENFLEKLLPEEVHCAVIEIPDAMKGAKIVAVTTEAVDQKSLLKKLAEHLPVIALPKVFLVMENLPKMGSGKIDFRTLTEVVRDELAREGRKSS
ncbi:MAG: AMP-binding protein [Desulfopila sp.]